MSASAYEYMYNHVVLPPKLPQEDDFDADHEKELLRCVLDSLARFHAVVGDGDTLQVLFSVSHMLKSTMAVLDSLGEINSEALVAVLQKISSAGQ